MLIGLLSGCLAFCVVLGCSFVSIENMVEFVVRGTDNKWTHLLGLLHATLPHCSLSR